jgi:hypothetical protein
VLKNLVGSRFCATTVDVGCARGLLESRGIFADVDPPDVVQRASAEAMNTFTIIGTNDNIGEDSSGLQNEDGIRIASFSLVVAGRY